MPGLVGIVSTKGERMSLGLMRAMRDAIRHRDWYQVDDYVSPKGTVAISRVHLGIINKEKQPYSGRNGKVKVFLHGEIYNEQVVCCKPLEFIYQLYEKNGVEFASSLNGSFVIVIVDEDEDVVLVANDRVATKPLFHFSDGRFLYFGPEMKSLFWVPSLERKLNLAAVADFMANGQFIRDHTLIEGIETVDNATVLQVTTGGVTRHKYWTYDLDGEYRDQGREYYQEKLVGLVRQAVRRRLRTDNIYGILLSGGYDSRGILGFYLDEKGAKELRTISWGREEDIPNSDCAIAKRLAQESVADHRFYQLTTQEIIDNFRDFIFLGEGLTWFPESYDVFHRIKEHQGVDIVLRGDECFGWKERMVYDEHTMFRILDLRALRNVRSYQKILKPSYFQLFGRLDAETTEYVSSRCSAKNIHNRKDFFYLDVRLKYLLNPLNYAKNFAIESFTPLLDNDILDFVSALPVKYRLDKNLYKKTIVEAFPSLFQEVAKRDNAIDWATSFREDAELRRFIYQELIEKQNIFSEFVDMESLKNELDAFLAAPASSSTKGAAAATVHAGPLLFRTSPTAYHVAHKSIYYSQKWRGRIRDPLRPERLILHLLILKAWGDVFLNYPTAKIKE